MSWLWPPLLVTANLCPLLEAPDASYVQFPSYAGETIIGGISQLCNLIQVLMEARRRRIKGGIVPSTQKRPGHEIVVFLPIQHQPHHCECGALGCMSKA